MEVRIRDEATEMERLGGKCIGQRRSDTGPAAVDRSTRVRRAGDAGALGLSPQRRDKKAGEAKQAPQ